MTAIPLEMPNDLILAISNKAHNDEIEFSDAAIELMRSGLKAEKKAASANEDGAAFLQLLIERARNYHKASPFTTESLVSESEWESVNADTRKSAGRGFSKAVKDGVLDEIRNTGKKTLQNKSIYVRD